MVKHIVMWRLKEEAGVEDARKIKELLERLKDICEGAIEIEVGIDTLRSTQSFDVSLYSVFESKEALEAYNTHPEHLKAVDFIKSVVCDRIAVDY